MLHREAIKAALMARLHSPGDPGTVVSLVGPWGCGKTHLWQEVEAELTKKGARTAYVSLFGVGTLTDLKGALVNEAVFSVTPEDAGRFARFKERLANVAVRSLPGVLQALDNKIGGPLIAKHVDLSRFLPEETVVCFDDLERLSDTLKVQDILGFASYLAEQRKSRVVLIMNDEHLRERHQDQYETILKAYRERVVRSSFRMSPNLREVLEVLPTAHRSGIDATAKQVVLSIMERAGSANIRTLVRALDRIADAKRVLGEHCDAPHLAFTTAITIDDAEGKLREEEFYNFHPVKFVFMPTGRQEKPDETTALQLAFFNRYYEPSGVDYRFSKSIYRLITNGYLDPQALFGEVREQIASVNTEVGKVFGDLSNRRVYFFSDAEHTDWMRRARNLLASDAELSAMSIIQLMGAISFSAEQSGHPAPPDIDDLAEVGLRRAASRLDDSFNEHNRIGYTPRASPRLVHTYDEALQLAGVGALKGRVLATAASGDLSGFTGIVRTLHSSHGWVLVDMDVLRVLHASRTNDRRFYFEALDLLARTVREMGSPQLLDALNGYFCACSLLEEMDHSDLYRLHRVHDAR